MTWKMLITAAVLGLGGCIVHGHGHLYPRVSVEAGHVHSYSCGHYHYGGHWYHHAGHVHGDGCGHLYRGGMWISID